MTFSSLIAPLLLVSSTPADAPKAPFERQAEEFSRTCAALRSRIQSDPHFAAMDIDALELTADIYLTGNAAKTLAHYTRDPRFHARRAPLSAPELGHLATRVKLWLDRSALAYDLIEADPRQGRVTIRSATPDRLKRAAHRAKLRMRIVRIVDSSPHYVPD